MTKLHFTSNLFTVIFETMEYPYDIEDSGDDSEHELSDVSSDIEEDIFSGDDETSEDDENAEEKETVSKNNTYLYGKDNKSVWYTQPQKSHNAKRKDTPHEKQANEGAVHPSVSTHTVFSTFNHFLTDEIINKTVEATNQRVNKHLGVEWEMTDATELRAWIGLHIRAGINRDGFRPVSELFSEKDGPPIYGACMGRKRFTDLKNHIRFDDANTRDVRRSGETEGNLAPIHEIFTKFIEACNMNYASGKYLTIDESIVPFRGRCSFKIYMPKKPDKYGVKIWTMADAKNSYPCNAQIYRGKSHYGPEIGQAQWVVRDLTSNIQHTGRNITVDNYFSTVDLANELLNRGLTMIGTLRKNKREIPHCFQASKTRDIYSTQFGFSKEQNMMMCSYVPRKRKAVIILRTHQHEKKVEPLPPANPAS